MTTLTLPDTAIDGIPCSLLSTEMRQAVSEVLIRIKDAAPSDHAKLSKTIRSIEPVPSEEAASGTLGEWRRLHGAADDPSTWSWFESEQAPGTLYLVDREVEHPVALVAHELGHAITVMDDLQKRGPANEELASELTADWHADRWGFGAELEAWRPTRPWMHHGVAPGGWFETEVGGATARYQVGHDLTVREVNTDTGHAEVATLDLPMKSKTRTQKQIRTSSLSHLSVDQLRAELSRRQRMTGPLQRRRAKLVAKLAEIDRQISGLGGTAPSAPTASSNGRRAVTRTRASNKTSLVESLRQVLKGKTMSTSDAIDAVTKAGYKSTSKHFRTMVRIALGKKEAFKRIARGQYTAR